MAHRDKRRSFNMLQACQRREFGLQYNQNIPHELLSAAEDRLVNKDHDELSCEMPGVPRSTFLMVFSPDGTKVASTHGNHNVYVTDLRTGKNINTLVGHPRTPWCIAFHPSSNQILATGCLGGQVRIWDLSGGSEVWTTECQTVIASLAFHPLERLLVIATFNELYFWDWSDPKPFMQACTNNIKEKVRYVAFDRLGHKLITGVANLPHHATRWERTRVPAGQQSTTNRVIQPVPVSNIFCQRRGNGTIRISQSLPVTTNRSLRMVNAPTYVTVSSYPLTTTISNNVSTSSGPTVTQAVNNGNSTTNNSTRDQERIIQIVQIYETLMQRFLEAYRTRSTSTIDRGTDPMEPSAAGIIPPPPPPATDVATQATTTGETSTQTGTTSSTTSVAAEGWSPSNPQPGPSGLPTRTSKRPRPKKNPSIVSPSDSSDDEPPIVLKRRIQISSHFPADASTSKTDTPTAESGLETITEEVVSSPEMLPPPISPLEVPIDDDSTLNTTRYFSVSAQSAFHPTATTISLPVDPSLPPDDIPLAMNSTSDSESHVYPNPGNVETQPIFTATVTSVRHLLGSPNRRHRQGRQRGDSRIRINPIRDMNFGSLPTLSEYTALIAPNYRLDRQITVSPTHLQNQRTFTFEPITSMNHTEEMASRLDLLEELRRIRDRLSTRLDPPRYPEENETSAPNDELLDIPSAELYGTDSAPVDLSASNRHSTDEPTEAEFQIPPDRVNDEASAPIDPTVDHNYMASSTAATAGSRSPELEPNPGFVSENRSFRHRLVRQIDLRRNTERARAELRQLHYIRHMCEELQNLLVRQYTPNMQANTAEEARPQPQSTEVTENASPIPSTANSGNTNGSESASTSASASASTNSNVNVNPGPSTSQDTGAGVSACPGSSSAVPGRCSHITAGQPHPISGCLNSDNLYLPNSASGMLRRVLQCASKNSALSKQRRHPHCARAPPRASPRAPHSATPGRHRLRSVPPLSARRAWPPRHRIVFYNHHGELRQLPAPQAHRLDTDIHENMPITPETVMTLVYRLEDLLRQQHNQPQVRFYRDPLTQCPSSRTERDILLRLYSCRSRLIGLGVRLDTLPRFLSDITGWTGESQNIFRARHILSIIIAALIRHFEVTQTFVRSLYDRLSILLQLCLILADTLLLNVIERIPPPEMRDVSGYLVTRLRMINQRMERERRYFRRQLARSLHTMGETRRHTYHIEDLSRMSVTDNEAQATPPDTSATPTSTESTSIDRVFGEHLDRLLARLRILATRLEQSISRISTATTAAFDETVQNHAEALRAMRRATTARPVENEELLGAWNPVPVPQVQVNDVPVPDPTMLYRPPLVRVHSQRLGAGGMFRPRFLHPLYAGINPFDADMDEPHREQIFGTDHDFTATVYPNHRIQVWNMADGKIPNITNPEKNIVVHECKINNDASVDISQDGNLLVTLLPSGGYSNITNKLGVYSIQWDNLGELLYTTSFEQNAVSVSLSATARYLAVGLASRRMSIVPGGERCIMAQLYKLDDDGRTILARDIERSRDPGYTSVNCIRWSPVPGQGLVYATNTGHLKVLT